MGIATDLPPNRNISFRILVSFSKKSMGTTMYAISVRFHFAQVPAYLRIEIVEFRSQPPRPTGPVGGDFEFGKIESREYLLQQLCVVEML